MWDSKNVNNAIFFATEKHKGQVMKQPKNMPYSAHFFGVAMNAIQLAAQSQEPVDWDLLICAAILHDTLEDTSATKEELEQIFGKRIADGVSALTKNKKLPKSEQMRDSLNRIKQQPFEIAIVKIADSMFNIRDRVENWSEEKQEQYKEEARLISAELGELFLPAKEALEEQIEKY